MHYPWSLCADEQQVEWNWTNCLLAPTSLITQHQRQEKPIPFDMSTQKLESHMFRKTGAWHASAMCYSLNYYLASDSFRSSWCLWMNYFLGMTSFNHISPPHPCRHRGMIKQLKWRLIWIHTQPRPRAFYAAQHSCLVSCEVVVRCPFHQGVRLHWSQHWPTPCCFALRDANAGRLQCLRSCSSAWQRAPTGSLPRKKPLRESRGPRWNTCFTKGLQASASSLVSLRETLAQCSSKWKQDPEKKKKNKNKHCSLGGY